MPSRSGQPASLMLEALQAVLNRVAEPSRVLKTILSQAVAQTGADRGVFVEIGKSGEITYRVLYRYQRRDLTGEAGRFSSTVFKRVLDSGEGVMLANAIDDPRYMDNVSVQDLHLVSILCMPIRDCGEIRALVHLESKKSGHFTAEHRDLIQSLTEIAGPALGALQATEGVMRERDALRITADSAEQRLKENREFLAKDWSFGRFVGRSTAVRELGRTVQKAARTDFPVLMLGETGTGKSILARVLHHGSPRSKEEFITVFCPSLEKGMVETELFGHKRGAFTGAVSDRMGKIQAAGRGTLFLDEIGELPLEIQPKLLRLLQEKTYERVGDPRERKAEARVVAATNRDLVEEVRAGRFRRDLFERLNFVQVRIPPLRERRDDIPLLLRHALDKNDAGRWVELTDDALRFLTELDFSWPGNVRHVEQLAARLAMDPRDEPWQPDELMRLLDTHEGNGPAEAGGPVETDFNDGLPALLGRAERTWLAEAIQRYQGLSRAELAAKLKISESALYKKLRLYGITS